MPNALNMRFEIKLKFNFELFYLLELIRRFEKYFKIINMQESEFVKVFENIAKQVLSDVYIVEKGKKLAYEFSYDNKLKITYSPFQTDICISEKINEELLLPRVVIEFKTKITTHDVITYSYKAGLHKKIYPFLRYGLLASEMENVPDRFFMHNENIDFYIGAKQYKKNMLEEMTKELIEKEIETSKTLEKIFFEKMKVNYYRTDVIFRDFEKEL